MPVRTADPAARADPAPPIGGRGRGRLGRYAPSLALLAITGAVALRDPHHQGAWGVCPTYQLLGVYCPGCGSLRALHDLAIGRWAEAVAHNALVVPAGQGAGAPEPFMRGAGELLLLADFCKGAGSPCPVQLCGQARKKLFARGHSARKA